MAHRTWFLTPDPRPGAVSRLICLPYAGAGAAVYRAWGRRLSPRLEVLGVQLPGRGWRLGEPSCMDLDRLADQVARAISSVADRPFAVFGHSMGAWLGLLVARRLEEWGIEPIALLVSGRQAPSLGFTQPPLSHLDDDAFVQEMQSRYGAIAPEILADRELLDLLLPALRADIAALESYIHTTARPLVCPIIALVGEADALVPVESLAPWSAETTGSFQVQTFPGGHFYFQDDPGPLLRSIERRLALDSSVSLESSGR